jgi:Flp pilus assembly protein TadD
MALIAAAAVVAFWPCHSSLLLDDDLLAQADGRGAGFQPLTLALLRVEHAAWATDPRGYHIVTLALHIANGLLVYLLGLALLRAAAPTARFPAAAHVGAATAALLLALHPLRVEPAAWAAQCGVLLSTLFLLLSVLLYIRACADRHWPIAALICYALSLAAGPWGAALPLILVMLDAWPLRRFKAQTGNVAQLVGEKAAFAVLAAVALALGSFPGGLGFVDRLVLTAHGFVFYLWKTIWPRDLLPIYELHLPLKLAEWDWLAPAIAVPVVLVVLACCARRAPALALATFSYLLLLLSVALLLQSDLEAAADRYSYLPSVALMLALGAGLTQLWQSADREMRTWAIGATVAAIGAAAALGVLTWRQCRVWHTPLKLWTYAEQHDRKSAVVAYELGRLSARAGEYERAVQFYRAAVEARPTMRTAQQELGNALMQVMNFKDAIKAYRQAVALNPHDAEAHFLLGATLAAAAEFPEAEEQLRQAAALDNADVRPRQSLGHLFMLMNRPANAAEAFRKALDLVPHDADLYYNLGRAELRAGQAAEAAVAFRRALRENPAHGPARQALDRLTTQPTSSPAARE